MGLAEFHMYACLPFVGLLYDDTLYEDKYVEKAIKRLPKPMQDARNFRIIRALELSNKKLVLPKEEWTKMEEVRL